MTPLIDIAFFGEGDEHRYELDGEDVPSVTQIMDCEALASYEWSTQTDLDRGKSVHRIAQLLAGSPLKGKSAEEIVRQSRWIPEETTPAVVGYGYGAALYLLESGIKPILVESPLASARMRIAGTLDLYGEMPNGAKALIDFKSGQPRPAVWLQLSAYACLLKETYNLEVDWMAPVWLRRDGAYKTWPGQPPGGANLHVFMSAVNCYQWRRKNKML